MTYTVLVEKLNPTHSLAVSRKVIHGAGLGYFLGFMQIGIVFILGHVASFFTARYYAERGIILQVVRHSICDVGYCVDILLISSPTISALCLE